MGFSKESKEIRRLLPYGPLKIVAFIFRSAYRQLARGWLKGSHQDFATLKSCKSYHPLDLLELLSNVGNISVAKIPSVLQHAPKGLG